MVLLVAGDGDRRPKVETFVREGENSATVRVLGFRSDVARILAAADFFVLSSAREGLSYSLLEAMAAGLPPIVSDAAPNIEAVGDTGIVIPYGDAARFADAFERVANDNGSRLALGEQARERVIRQFRIEDMVDRTRAVYEQVGRAR